MQQVHNYEEIENLTNKLNHKLKLLFIKRGIDAQIFTDSPYIHNQYPDPYPEEFRTGIWQIVIDVSTYKYSNGQDVLPQLSENDIINGHIYNKFTNFRCRV
jgi:hypothetical protein